jgi:hypothetical protein
MLAWNFGYVYVLHYDIPHIFVLYCIINTRCFQHNYFLLLIQD